jgi:hypothetical protein
VTTDTTPIAVPDRRRVEGARACVLASVLAGVLSLSAIHAVTAAQDAGPRPGGVPPGPPPAGAPGPLPDFATLFQERPLVAQFDRDGDRRLDRAERQAARAWLATQPPAGLAAVIGQFGPPGGLATIMDARGFAPSSPGRRLTPADVPSGGAAPLYDTSTLRTIFLEFENADWEQELAAFYNTDVEVPATVTVDGVTLRDVGVHFRGMSSFAFVPAGSKRSLNLSIDDVHRDQRVLGYRTLNLTNGNSDPTYVRGLLYAEIARHYVPTPKTNYVRTVINGESWGIFVNVQQFNTDFINDWFSTRRGARWRVPGSPFGQGGMEYLGENPDAYRPIYSIRSRDDARSWSDLIRMFRVLNETPPERLEAALAPLLDVDGALKFLALELALVNSDGYWVRASDYNIYQDEQGRFHILPHDINEALAEEEGPSAPPPGVPIPFPPMFGRGGVDLDPLVGLDDASKPLRSKLLAVPALRERYLAYVRELAERWLDWNTLEPLVRQYQGVIAADVKSDTRKLYSYDQFESGVLELKDFVDRRRAFLLEQVR